MDKFKEYLKNDELNDKHEQAKDKFIKDATDTFGKEKVDTWLQDRDKDILK